jgi:hypothetical protein
LITVTGPAARATGQQMLGPIGPVFGIHIADRTQRQRQPVGHLLGNGDDFSLTRRELERSGLSDLHEAALLVFANGLVDRQNSDVLENGLGDIAAAAVRRARRHDDVDIVVRVG